MSGRLTEIWVYLATTPLLGLTVTLLAYQAAYWLYMKARMNPLANPVAISVAFLVALLWFTETPYETYFEGAQFVHFLLGPATVALAVPLFANLERLRRDLVPLLGALLAGSFTAVAAATGIAWLAGASRETVLSLAPKSVTTPIAMGVAEKLGGLPSLTAVLVVSTGIIGAVLARSVLAGLRIDDDAVSGFALGIAAHGIGTARAFQVSATMGAFAGLAMGLNGIVTAILSWVFIIGVGFTIAVNRPEWGAVGPWIGAALFITTLGIAMVWRFARGPWREIDLLNVPAVEVAMVAAAAEADPVDAGALVQGPPA